jgi:hypothetical protein
MVELIAYLAMSVGQPVRVEVPEVIGRTADYNVIARSLRLNYFQASMGSASSWFETTASDFCPCLILDVHGTFSPREGQRVTAFRVRLANDGEPMIRIEGLREPRPSTRNKGFR